MVTTEDAQQLLTSSPPKSPSPPSSSPPHMPPPPQQTTDDPIDKPLASFRLSISLCLRVALFAFNIACVVIGTPRTYYLPIFFLIILFVGLIFNFYILIHAITHYLSLRNESRKWEGLPKVIVKIGNFGFTCGEPKLPRLPTILNLPSQDVLERGATMLGGGDKKKAWFKRWARVSIADIVFGVFSLVAAIVYNSRSTSWWWSNHSIVELLGFNAALHFLIPIVSCWWACRSLKVRIYRDEEEDFKYEYSMRLPEAREAPVGTASGIAT